MISWLLAIEGGTVTGERPPEQMTAVVLDDYSGPRAFALPKYRRRCPLAVKFS